MLWHMRLGHISIDRIKRLVNDGVLEALGFINFSTCINYKMGKQTIRPRRVLGELIMF